VTGTQPSPGPYETIGHARADAQHVYDETGRRYQADGAGLIARINYGQLYGTLTGAGVELGAYDLTVLDLLADTLPEEVQVLLGLIVRTRAAADTVLRREIDTLRAQVESLETDVRRAAPLGIDFDGIRTIIDGRAD